MPLSGVQSALAVSSESLVEQKDYDRRSALAFSIENSCSVRPAPVPPLQPDHAVLARVESLILTVGRLTPQLCVIIPLNTPSVCAVQSLQMAHVEFARSACPERPMVRLTDTHLADLLSRCVDQDHGRERMTPRHRSQQVLYHRDACFGDPVGLLFKLGSHRKITFRCIF